MQKVILTLVIALLASPAFAAPEYTYTVNGKGATVSEALTAAMKGANVTRCQPVEASPNKKGTSIGLKAKKSKPAT